MKRRTIAWVAVAVLAPTGLMAQTTSVGEPVATYTDGLGSLRGVRELPDGRVMIADGLGEALIVWTPGAGADTLTNVGQGPEEYQVPDGLFALPDGATLLVDLGNARLTRIDADLSFGDTWPIAQGSLGPGMTMIIPSGTDDQGRIYYQQRMGGMMGVADSAIIARFDPAADETAELGRVGLPEQKREESGGANNRSVNIRPVPLSPQDAWSPAWDGRVAVARADEYRVEWLGDDGVIASGGPIDYDPVGVGGAERDEWLETLGGGLSVSVMATDGGAPQISLSRPGNTRGSGIDPDDLEWPDVKPAFPAGAVRVDPAGNAWVRRSGSAGEAPVFDIFDASGSRIGQVELPEDRRLVAFGDGSIYLERIAEFDFAFLEKYDAPTF